MSFRFKDVYADGVLIVQNKVHWQNIKATLKSMGYEGLRGRDHIKLFPNAVLLTCIGTYYTYQDLKSAIELDVPPVTLREVIELNSEWHEQKYTVIICKPNIYTRAIRASVGAMEYIADVTYKVFKFLRGK